MLEREATLTKDNLTVTIDGKKYTEDMLTAMQNGIDLAKTSSQQYADAMKEAVNVVDDLGAAWNRVGIESSNANAIIDSTTAAHTTTTTTTTTPAPTAAPTAAPAPAARTYTIVRGDTLWAIARRYYGDGSQYMKIFNASNFRSGNPNLIYPGEIATVPYAMGGLVAQYRANGGSIFKSMGTDTVPAMLTPGEFVVKKFAVDQFGANNLNAINSGSYDGGSVYNSYEINVSVKSDANPDQIARAVTDQIRNIDAQRIRGNRL